MQNGINFQLMAKPPGAACNLRCDYCFYLEKIQLYPQHTAHRKMDDATLENYIRQTIAAQHAPVVDFIWQGGEPTLAGIDFYRRALELQQRYAQGRQINNFFQTNGVNLNDDWARFFKRHRFLVGLSLDGDSITHDRYRRSRAGKGTFNEVMAGLACLKRHHVDFNTLTVVNADNVARPKEIYHFLRRAGSRYMQFIPLVERRASEPDASGLTLVTPDFKGDCRVAPWSVPALAYGRFLNAIFDHWAQHDIGAIFVMNFEQTLAKLVGQPGICVQSETSIIPYNERTSQGVVFRYREGGKKMADFPAEWLRGDNPRDRYDGVLPDQYQKEKADEQVFASFEKTEALIHQMLQQPAR